MGTLSFKNKIYFFTPTREDAGDAASERNLAKNAGLEFDKELKVYWTSNTSKAIRLRAYADLTAKENFDQLTRNEIKSPKRLIYPVGLTPRSYQLEGARHILSYNWSYIADDAGLGKTITAIIAVNSAKGKTVIVCPPSLKYNWMRELNRWGVGLGSIKIIDAKTKLDDYDADVIIIPDSLLDRKDVRVNLSLLSFEWLIIDEAHRFKEIRTARTQALYGRIDEDEADSAFVPLYKSAKRVVAMSGTPMPNGRPIEMFPMLNALAPDTIEYRSYSEFAHYYCGAYHSKFGFVVNGESNLPELRERIRRDFMLRRRKADVLKELPPKTRQLIFLDDPSKKLRAWEEKAITQYKIDDVVSNGDEPLGELARLRKEIGLAMVKPAVEFIRDFMESSTDQKLVVFAWHREVIKNLSDHLIAYKPLVIQGGTDSSRKDEIIQRFQTKKLNRLIILNIEAGGVGHTLTAASRVVFVEPSWVDTVNDQAEDRVHRMGQRDHVLSQYLVSSGGFMEYLLSRVFSKQKNVDEVMS